MKSRHFGKRSKDQIEEEATSVLISKVRKFYKPMQKFSILSLSRQFSVSLEKATEVIMEVRGLLDREIKPCVPAWTASFSPNDTIWFRHPSPKYDWKPEDPVKLRAEAMKKKYGVSRCSRCQTPIVGDGKRNRSRHGHTKDECDLKTAELILRM